ncbi:hypothetical protein SJ05684_c23270 [Sinorhizobium sojae CCBAU 05684]|uniref:Uncharacterized protein n=1 Tax=Sinorhizobium sojae CCBAU 05684 TaxID=716928 RepID=A0A249PCX6_9HYPH|nr:hypothetical protein SJ05684_c23270 [Sinorhizobium sojae CCBAU 05684]
MRETANSTCTAPSFAAIFDEERRAIKRMIEALLIDNFD